MASWQVETHTPQNNCDNLLKILRRFHPELPRYTKTLVKTTNQKVTVVEMPPGSYKHIGIEVGIVNTLRILRTVHIPYPLNVFVGIDGVSLTNSSSSQFWPIVGYISNLKLSLPFVIGVFHGGGKPQNANDFLETFVNEANELRRNGLVFAGCRVTVHVEALICDAPARAMVAFIKSHISSLHGCGRCTGSGVNVGLLRRNENFRLQSFPDHHHLLKSYLENSEGFNMVFLFAARPYASN